MYPILASIGAKIALLTSETPALQLNFNAAEMFTYTNVITGSLMPIVYISAGLTG